jgi:hypothetical protein
MRPRQDRRGDIYFIARGATLSNASIRSACKKRKRGESKAAAMDFDSVVEAESRRPSATTRRLPHSAGKRQVFIG